MELDEFARVYGLRKSKLDECGDMNIRGKRGTIYTSDRDHLAATVLNCPNAHHWNQVRTAATTAGCIITQNGDWEGSFTFNGQDPIQAKIAIQAIRAFRKRKMSPEALNALARARALARKTQL